MSKELERVSEIQKRMAPFANLPKLPDFYWDKATVARIEAMQKANQAFADQIKHSLASLEDFNQAFAGLETFSRIAEQQARLFQNGVASAISKAMESVSKFPKIDWEAVARDLADAPI